MKFILPVELREYENSWIAQTLSEPNISVAGSEAQSTLDRLRKAIVDIYSRTHPKIIKDAMDAQSMEIRRELRPLYKSGRYEWNPETDKAWHDNVVSAPIDVITIDRNSDMQEILLPQFALRSLTRKSDLRKENNIDSLSRTLESIHENSWSITNHRPLSKSSKIVNLEIRFDPIDLAQVSPETIHVREFSRSAISGGVSQESTPTLNKVAQKWEFKSLKKTEEKGFAQVFGRDKLIGEIQSLLDGEKAISIVLVGPTRVGKTALLKHLAWTKNHSDFAIKKRAMDRTLFFADSPRLVSTAPQGGLWQEQVQNILNELETTDSILYIGRLIASLDAGKYDGSDYNLAQFIRPFLSNHRVRVVAEASNEEWSEIEKRDVGFARTFTVVRVIDPSPQSALNIVQKSTAQFAKKYDFSIEEAAVSRAWMLQKRFAIYGSPLGRTIEFIRRTIRSSLSQYKTTLSETELVEAFCADTGLPLVLLLDSQQLKPQTVFDALAKRVVGQDEAIQSVANIVSITKAGLSSPDRPLGSFMFVGPTGVGKTELAKSLAAFLFGNEDRMTRLDMSEYANADAYSRLIGEGSKDGDLTGPVKREPFSVVLLDEIEKAHPSVYDILLQVLGEARLTDVKGRTTRFQNTIIIMTSNLGVDNMRASIGFGDSKSEDYQDHFRKEAEKFYRPEFLGRIDQFIAFRSLPLNVVTHIAKRSLTKIQERDGFKSQDVSLHFDDQVAPFLARKGYHEKYGARPLKREIEQELVWKLANRMASTKDKMDVGGARRINVSIKNDKLKIDVHSISATDTDMESRSRLLRQVDEVSNLRRRLSTYVHTVLFGELEWEIENFDISTQSPQFWNDPRAAELAANAEKIRKVVQPAEEITAELETLEDLATEAYHTRSFDLLPEIGSRMQTLESRVDEIFTHAMNASYDSPDKVVLFVFNHSPQHHFCQTLAGWYGKWAETNDWKMSMWNPIEVDLPDDEYRVDFDKESWEKITEVTESCAMVALSFEGFNARPMLRVEEGIHRYVSNSGNGTCQIVVLGEQSAWPYSEDVMKRSLPNFPARTYNFRVNDVTLSFGVRADIYGDILETVGSKLFASDPISSLKEHIRDEAWNLSALDWE